MLTTSLLIVSAGLASADLPTCQVYAENQCDGDVIITDPSFEDHRWYTPSKTSKEYRPSFQDYSVLAAHAHVVYDASQTSATVKILADHRDSAVLKYSFNGKEQNSNTIKFTSANKSPVPVSVKGADGSSKFFCFLH